MIATLIGATGLTGGFVLQQLLADSTIAAVISVSRRRLDVEHAKLRQVIIADLGDLPSIASTIRGNLYFCCLGTTIKTAGSRENFEKVDYSAIVGFATIAKAHTATSFTFVSASGANARSMFFYNRVKGQTEADVRALALRSLTIFRPALLVGPRRDYRAAERLAVSVLLPLSQWLPPRIRKSMVTEAALLAARMVAEGKAALPGVRVIEAIDI